MKYTSSIHGARGLSARTLPRGAATDPASQSALIFLFLAGVTIFLRLYQVGQLPLWFDEIYGFQVAQDGLETILRNSRRDLHPPLSYGLLWVSSGFGLFRSEIGVRWLSVLAGSLTVLLTYHLARQHVGRVAALVGSLLFAVSPMHIFFSQEARSNALVTLLATLSIYGIQKIAARPSEWRGWVWYMAVSLGGLHISYVYGLLVATQLAYLFFVRRQRKQTVACGLALALLCLPLLYFFLQAAPVVVANHQGSRNSLLEFVLALLGGDPIRFGFFWGHYALLGLVVFLAGIGIADRSNHPALFSYWSGPRCSDPYLLVWGLLIPGLGLHIPLSEAKHFLIVLPALFLLVCFGLDCLFRKSRKVDIVAWSVLICIIGGAASGVGLSRYWHTGKSPEGEAVLALRRDLQPQDAVVSTHYSLDAALSFYLPEQMPYSAPRYNGSDWEFSRSDAWVPGEQHVVAVASVAELYARPRVWLLTDSRHPSAMQALLRQRCDVATEQHFDPFDIVLLTECSADPRPSAQDHP